MGDWFIATCSNGFYRLSVDIFQDSIGLKRKYAFMNWQLKVHVLTHNKMLPRS